MDVGHWAWALFTVMGAASQTIRNTAQRELTARIGTAGATQVRFLYGLPFSLLFLGAVVAFEGRPPALGGTFLLWTVAGAVAQVFATAFLLAAMRDRSFVVIVAYSKTEPVQVALFGLAVLGDPLTIGVIVAILAATFGVMLLSWPKRSDRDLPRNWMPAVLGIVAGSFFALASVGFRGAILTLETPSFVLAATTTLVVGLTIQTAITAVYMALFDRAAFIAVFVAWRTSIIAGFTGALASQFWFLAFALESAARVRTLGLVEILFAQLVSMRILRQGVRGGELLGLGLVIIGVVLVVNG